MLKSFLETPGLLLWVAGALSCRITEWKDEFRLYCPFQANRMFEHNTPMSSTLRLQPIFSVFP